MNKAYKSVNLNHTWYDDKLEKSRKSKNNLNKIIIFKYKNPSP